MQSDMESWILHWLLESAELNLTKSRFYHFYFVILAKSFNLLFKMTLLLC